METRVNASMEAMVLDRLMEMGLIPEPVVVTKNGIECTGLRIINPRTPNVSPVVYYTNDDSVDELMERITRAVQCNPPQICVDQLTDPEYIAKNVYMTVQRCSFEPENVVKRPCMNLELVLRVAVKLGDHEGSVKVSKDMLQMADMSEDSAWAIARLNMSSRLHIISMMEALGLPDELAGNMPMAVCTTYDRLHGAVGLVIPEIFREFCDSHESEGAYLLPSSTEELIVIPDNLRNMNALEMAQMVQDINENVVDNPLITLDPVVYHYDLESNSISIVASYKKGGVQ